VNAARVLFVGGLISFRALFNWLTPWIYVPVLLVVPVTEVFFFVYVGRAAHLESDRFYVIGNAVQLTAMPCLFAMSATLAGERRSQTLSSVLGTPANRVALYFGRALPVIVNGFAVSAFAFAVGALVFHVRPATGGWPLLALCVLVAAFSSTGLGLICGAFGLRGRDTAVLANLLAVLLVLFCGANVPLASLPDWMQTVAQGLPLTHGIEAAREAVAGSATHGVTHLLLVELGVGAIYAALGLLLLRALETDARRRATLDIF
jgi:ABC-2 type transport system permease protein